MPTPTQQIDIRVRGADYSVHYTNQDFGYPEPIIICEIVNSRTMIPLIAGTPRYNEVAKTARTKIGSEVGKEVDL